MIYIFSDLELDEQLHELRRAGEPFELEPKVFEFLVYLICHRDRCVSRDERTNAECPSLGRIAVTLPARIVHGPLSATVPAPFRHV
jgi:hypothetical protein